MGAWRNHSWLLTFAGGTLGGKHTLAVNLNSLKADTPDPFKIFYLLNLASSLKVKTGKIYHGFIVKQINDENDPLFKEVSVMKNKLTGVLATALVVTMILPTGAKAFSESKTTVVTGEEVASQELKKIAAEKAELLTKSHGAASVQYALIDNGKLILSGQAGKNDMEGEKPLTKDTLYGIGSVSKMYATAAVMKLVDEGKVDLDAPVVRYVPDFKMKDGRYKRITPRMLLNHSSGLQGSTLGNAFLFNDNDTYAHDTLLQQLSNQNLKADLVLSRYTVTMVLRWPKFWWKELVV